MAINISNIDDIVKNDKLGFNDPLKTLSSISKTISIKDNDKLIKYGKENIEWLINTSSITKNSMLFIIKSMPDNYNDYCKFYFNLDVNARKKLNNKILFYMKNGSMNDIIKIIHVISNNKILINNYNNGCYVLSNIIHGNLFYTDYTALYYKIITSKDLLDILKTNPLIVDMMKNNNHLFDINYSHINDFLIDENSKNSDFLELFKYFYENIDIEGDTIYRYLSLMHGYDALMHGYDVINNYNSICNILGNSLTLSKNNDKKINRFLMNLSL